MPEIKVLKNEVIDQIAAGEVVERPASVVKELVENSLDAGARRIHVEIEEGGRGLIRVVDDGHGMTAGELALCLQRHATSKLRGVEDLGSLLTMGFRGEALPTIASVSRFSITSRPRDGELGAKVTVEGGKAGEVEPAGAPCGTTVQAADLFYNTPARLKFLKSTATEAAHITDVVNRAALCAPEVHFSLVVDGRKTIDHPPCKDRLERCRGVLSRWGSRLSNGHLAKAEWRAEAVLAPPSENLRTSRQLVLVVNGRHVRDRALLQAVLAGFGQMMDRGRFPVAVVYLDMPPDTLDVNVHPQKVEVRFAEPRQVFSLIKRCVEEVLASSSWLDSTGEGGSSAGTAGAAPPAAVRKYTMRAPAQGGYDEHKSRLMEATRRFWSRRPSALGASEQPEDHYPQDRRPNLPLEDSKELGFFGSLRVIGQAMGLFIVCEGEDEILLIDQHAAHERVTFERLKTLTAPEGGGSASIPSQRLLVPATIDLDPGLDSAAREAAGRLGALGLEIEPFGGSAWTVRALPLPLRDADPEALARDMLEELIQQGESSLIEEAQDALLARMACHGSVRQGRSLNAAEISSLLRDLDRIDFAAACPHGRPIMVRLPRSELEGKLKR